MAVTLDELNKRILSNAQISGVPVFGSFELTARCNFKCRMCYVRQDTDSRDAMASELSAAQWIETAYQARDEGLINLTLTGGEIFLRDDFLSIYEALSNMGLVITLYTNGSLITREIAQFLAKVPPQKVSVTLYGSNAGTYERVTGSGAHFDRVIHALDLLKECGVGIELKTTIVRQNYEEYDEMAELVRSRYNLALHVVDYISPRRDACGSSQHDNRLNPRELALFEQTLESYNTKLQTSPANKRARILRDEVDDNLTDKMEFTPAILSRSPFRCLAGKCGFWITADGRVTPCGLLNEPSRSIQAGGFKNAWDDLKRDCLSVPACEECSQCHLSEGCLSCPGRRMTETGSFDQKAPYLCSLSQMREQLKKASYKASREVKK